MDIEIYQICYSQELLRNIPEGFLPLDNSENLRPDWREYWPIRNFLLSNELSSDKLYGFMSPKFSMKTGLNYGDICNFIHNNFNNQDIFSFSPFGDLSAFFINSFEQGDFFQPGLLDATQRFINDINYKSDLSRLVSDFNTTIFCNYFLANRKFWLQWLEIGEKLFNYCESDHSSNQLLLNQLTNYGGQQLPMKIFLQERLADYVLLTTTDYKNLPYDPMLMPFSSTPIGNYQTELFIMNSLKRLFIDSGDKRYLEFFIKIRGSICNKIIIAHPELAHHFKRIC